MSKHAEHYKQAGVDIEAAGQFIQNIKKMVKTTFTKGVITDIGGFGGLFKMDMTNIQEPVLVAGADGVGTKLKLAFAFDRHDTIGIDLVAMSVNDILVQGALPLFFLDYLAMGKLDAARAEQVVAGVAEGCRQAKCALLGGETAEMPGFYAEGEYDLSGFCVGVVDNAAIVDGSSITIGDQVIGLASTGLHSNGFSLVRKILDKSGLAPTDIFPGADKTVAEVLLEPTRIYTRCVRSLLRDLPIKGMAHITGGGFYENLPRVLPDGVSAHLKFGAWSIPVVFEWLKNQGGLDWEEMLTVFNCGVGYMVVTDKNSTEDVINRLSGMDVEAWTIGEICKRPDNQEHITIDLSDA
jgi:phosphoribosylformylglycinamidine cyclo-ligase